MNKTPVFQEFWDAYGLKRDRVAAERVWERLSAADKRKAISAIADYRTDCVRRGVNRMYAQGYLSHRRWEDEFSADADAGGGAVSVPADASMKVW